MASDPAKRIEDRRGRARWALLAGLAALIGALSIPAAAAALVYWGESTGVGAANLDGSLAVTQYPYGAANVGVAEEACGVAVDATHLYWASERRGAIGRIGLSSSPDGLIDFPFTDPVPIEPWLVAGVEAPCGVAVDAGHVYWGSGEGVGRANLDGSGADPDFIPVGAHPCGIAVDAGHVYWGNYEVAAIGRAAIDGSEVENEFIPGTEACGVAVDARHVYWSSSGTGIGRANLGGSQPDFTFIPLSSSVCGVAVDGTRIYWTNRFPVGVQVGTANLDGSGARTLISNRYGVRCGTAVDTRAFVPVVPVPRPSRQFIFGKVYRDLRRGTAVIEIWVPEHGELSVRSRKVAWKVIPKPRNVGGRTRERIKIWAGAKGRAGRAVRQSLRRRGIAKVGVRVVFSEAGQLPVEQVRRLALRKKAAGKSARRVKRSVGHRR